MKILLISIFITSSMISAYGQNADKDSLKKGIKDYRVSAGNYGRLSDEKLKFLMEKDTIVRVVYNKEKNNENIPAYFVNDFQINNSSIKFIDPNSIENIFVENGVFESNGRKYNGKIYIKLKENIEFKPISISDLKTKYLNLPELSTIFMVDGSLVYDNLNDVIVNERNIYKIEVERLDSENGKLKLNTVNIITRTENNIKKSEEIKISG